MPSASPELPQPWDTFLAAVDALLPDPVELHRLGGLVVALRYHLPRPTGDLDYIEIIPHHAIEVLQRIAGPQSPLAKKHHLYFQHVRGASLPESDVDRTERLPSRFN